jgi:hypothetical protein
VTSFDAEVLAQQLAQLGRDLQQEVRYLGELDEATVEAEGFYRRLDEEHQDRVAQEFLNGDGTVDSRKMQARLKAVPARLVADDAWLEWNRTRAKLRTQQASLNALNRRIDIGRSLLARERSLLSLSSSGVDVL